MATVIDELVIRLGLDATKFDEGQRKVVTQIKGVKDATDQHIKPAQQNVENLVSSFAALQGRLLAIGSILAAGIGIAKFTQDIAALNTQLGFTADTLGLSIKQMTEFRGAARSVGASPDELAATIAHIQKSRAEFQLSGSSPLVAFSQATHAKGQGPGIDLYNKNGSWKSPEEVMIAFSRWYQAQPNKAVATQALTSRAGVSQGAMNLISLGPEELQKRFDFAAKFAPTPEDIQKFKDLTKAFGDLMTVVDKLETLIASKFAKTLTAILDKLTTWLGAVATNNQNPAEAAGSGLAQMGIPETAPKAGKGSIFSRSWNWLNGRGFTGDPAPAGGGGGGGGGSAAAPGAAPGGAAPSAPGGVSSGGSPFLQQDRAEFTRQASDPAVRARIAGMAASEDSANPTGPIESLANRFGYVNAERAKQGLPAMPLSDFLTARFYGPMRPGRTEFNRAMGDISRNPALAAKMERALQSVSGGSNATDGYTDQGMPTDPNGSLRNPGHAFKRIGGNEYTDWEGGPGGRSAASAYRQRLQQGVAASMSKSGNLPGALPQSASPSASFNDRWGTFAPITGMGSSRDALQGGSQTSNSTTNSSQTHIGEMNVTVPHGADPEAYSAGIKQSLQRYDNVQQSVTGLQ